MASGFHLSLAGARNISLKEDSMAVKKADQVLGVDIGGTGIKCAVVDFRKGELITERFRLETPESATPEAVIGTMKKLVDDIGWKGPVGCGFPGLVKDGVVRRAPNLDDSFAGYNLIEGIRTALGASIVAVGNDADVAGLAEARFGAGKGVSGSVVMVTLGTGIGTAVIHNGVLLPDTELGHIEMKGKDSERWASNTAREENGWSWKKWGKNVDRYLTTLEYLIGADRFIIGGGVSKKPEKFFPYLKKVGCEVVPASMGNLAGIVGAGLLAVPEIRRASRSAADRKRRAAKKS